MFFLNERVLFAGSEKSKTDTACTIEQQTESHNINKSLLVLGQSYTIIGPTLLPIDRPLHSIRVNVCDAIVT